MHYGHILRYFLKATFKDRKNKMAKYVLITGGAGYIGSHTCVELSKAGYNYIIIDNFCNSSLNSIDRINQITGREVKYIYADVRNKEVVERVFQDYQIDSVIHFAGYKAVG
jgi:UDP-glucose 4-epimerase